MSDSEDLIKDYLFELVEDHHSFGSGRYSVKVVPKADISPAFPYLNAVLDDSVYDHANSILIGGSNRRRYAFRPNEIQAGMVSDVSRAPSVAGEAVALVNRVWRQRDGIAPTLRERKLPAVYTVYRLLPGTNCRECGYPTCLACASDIRNGVVSLDACPLLSKPQYAASREQIRALFEE